MKDTLLTYKLYLQTLINIRDGNEVKGDRETLKILEKDLEGINENKRFVKESCKQRRTTIKS